jgi:hypothetical protein
MLRQEEEDHLPMPLPDEEEERPPRRDKRPMALCPGCHRPVPWEALACLLCGLELEPDGPTGPRRRDVEAHRGGLIATMGNISLAAGLASLCLMGLGALLSVPLGLTTWVMANRDLALIQAGLMDPAGKAQTANGRSAAIAGVVLGLLFALLFAAIYLGEF